jgi:ureidoacrylate peracid hydrolase
MLTIEELITRKTERIEEMHRYELKRTALVVVDMQRSFMDPQSSLYVSTSWDIFPPIKKMVEFCRLSGIPVIFTEFVVSPAIPNLRKDPFGPEHLVAEPGQPTGWGYPSSNSVLGMQGPEDPTTIDELKPLPHEPVIQGYTLDKFYGTPMDLVLRSLDVRYLMFTGMMADLCLAATLFSAANRDFRVTALTDCITTLWPNILEAVFDIFGRKLSRLQTSDQAIAELELLLEKDALTTP